MTIPETILIMQRREDADFIKVLGRLAGAYGNILRELEPEMLHSCSGVMRALGRPHAPPAFSTSCD